MYLTKIEPQANQFRFYRMKIVPGLFGDWGLIREWGRIGGGGRVRTDWFDSEEDAKDARFELHMQKAKRGYDYSPRISGTTRSRTSGSLQNMG